MQAILKDDILWSSSLPAMGDFVDVLVRGQEIGTVVIETVNLTEVSVSGKLCGMLVSLDLTLPDGELMNVQWKKLK